MSHLKRRWKGEPMLGKFAFYFNKCVLEEEEDSIIENISMDISWSQFYQKYYNIRCIKWCKY